MGITWVESYRKELDQTGYPFMEQGPFRFDTGYFLPIGTIVDASIYVDSNVFPKFNGIDCNTDSLTFVFDDRSGTFNGSDEIVELWYPNGIFGGILVVDIDKSLSAMVFSAGPHNFKMTPQLYPRCYEMTSNYGVTRFECDDGIASGDIAFIGGNATTLQTLPLNEEDVFTRIHFVGSPDIVDVGTPLRQATFSDTYGNSFVIRGEDTRDCHIESCNISEPLSYQNILRLDGVGHEIKIALGH